MDQFTFDRQFFATMVTSVVPLLGLLGALSYPLADLFRSLFEPFFRGLTFARWSDTTAVDRTDPDPAGSWAGGFGLS